MASDYFDSSPFQVPAHQTAKSSHVNDPVNGIDFGFQKLPKPVPGAEAAGAKGFDEPFTVVDPTSENHCFSLKSSRNNTHLTAPDTGSTNAYAMALDPPVTEYVSGLVVWLTPGSSNTGPSTLSLNGLPGIPITRSGTPLVSNDLVAGTPVHLAYNGSEFRIITALQDDVDKAQLARDAAEAAQAIAESAAGAAESSAGAAESSAENSAISEANAATSEANAEAAAAEAQGYADDAIRIRNNLLIDSEFRLRDGGWSSGDLVSPGNYGPDMWMSDHKGTAVGVSLTEGAPVNGLRIFTLTPETSGAPHFLEQKNDDLLFYNGREVTVSIAHGSVEVGGCGCPATTLITPSTPATFTVDETDNDGFFYITAGLASSVTFGGLQIIPGSVASPFVSDTEQDLLRAKRYIVIPSDPLHLNGYGVHDTDSDDAAALIIPTVAPIRANASLKFGAINGYSHAGTISLVESNISSIYFSNQIDVGILISFVSQTVDWSGTYNVIKFPAVFYVTGFAADARYYA